MFDQLMEFFAYISLFSLIISIFLIKKYQKYFFLSIF